MVMANRLKSATSRSPTTKVPSARMRASPEKTPPLSSTTRAPRVNVTGKDVLNQETMYYIVLLLLPRIGH